MFCYHPHITETSFRRPAPYTCSMQDSAESWNLGFVQRIESTDSLFRQEKTSESDLWPKESSLAFKDLLESIEDDFDKEDMEILSGLKNDTKPIAKCQKESSEQLPKEESKEALEVELFKKEKAISQTKNAARCRKHREKKKLEELEVYVENTRLKRERTEFLHQISDLEFEIQALRGQAAVDLSKENEVLREEIERHKKYIEQLMRVTLTTPVETLAEENIRIMKHDLESGVGQVVGLLYSSMIDNTWKRGNTFRMVLSDEPLIEVEAHIWYQYLPLGSSAEDAQRLNVRCDLDIPIPTGTLSNFFWSSATDVAILKTQLSEYMPSENFEIEQVFPRKDEEMKDVVCIRVRCSKDGKTKEQIFASSNKCIDVSPSAFAYEDQTCDLEPHKVKLVVSSSCNLKKTAAALDKSVERVRDMLLEGMVFREKDVNKCGFTSVHSISRSDILFDGITDLTSYIHENGVVSDDYVETLRAQWAKVLQECAPLPKCK